MDEQDEAANRYVEKEHALRTALQDFQYECLEQGEDFEAKVQELTIEVDGG